MEKKQKWERKKRWEWEENCKSGSEKSECVRVYERDVRVRNESARERKRESSEWHLQRKVRGRESDRQVIEREVSVKRRERVMC